MVFRDGMPDGKRSREERGMERGEDAGPRHAGLVGVGGGWALGGWSLLLLLLLAAAGYFPFFSI